MPNDYERQQPAPLPPGARAPSHEQATTFGVHIQEMGAQVKATAQDLGVQVKETAQDLGVQTAQDVKKRHRTWASRSRKR